jgi:hypothetical protein
MRKRARRLALHRETLRRLERTDLARVAGGGETYEIFTTCACTDTCDTNWSCGCGGSAEACGTGTTYEIYSGCATNCG